MPESGNTDEIETYWRTQIDTRISKSELRIYWPLRYGERIANAGEPIPAKKLKPGNYKISIDVVVDDTNELERAKCLYANFAVDNSMGLQNPNKR